MKRTLIGTCVVIGLALVLWGCRDDLPQGLAPESRMLPAYKGICSPPLSGAIFTTTVDGTIVNENVHYQAKEDVYLDGGPGPHAPVDAAGLPEGYYYFQVTDPSGKDLLSTDHISCRKVHVSSKGVIDEVYAGTNYTWKQGGWVAAPFKHATGVDQDHSDDGAITVQLFPYDDTPNRGGVYKVWLTPVDCYAGDPLFVPQSRSDPVNGEMYAAGYYHGFIPRYSKTDNYKVRGRPQIVPPEINVRKFHDANANGIWDIGELEITGWLITITDPLGVPNDYFTPVLTLAVEPGHYTVVESTESPCQATVQTVSFLDGATVSLYPNANPTVDVGVAGASGEKHTVVYGNVGVTDVPGCKIFDRNANGVIDAGEPGVPGWRIELSGTDVRGTVVGPIVQTTGADGCTTFAGLLPGTYLLTELIPAGSTWQATKSVSQAVTVESNLLCTTAAAAAVSVTFPNICYGYADFDTKGYWHNKNGLGELYADPNFAALLAYVNVLDPYNDPTGYFNNGEEPFDGYDEFGNPVPPAIDALSDFGLIYNEISQFLVDPNAGGDPREQLAQQLLAFIFNVNYRLDSPAALVELPDGSFAAAESLITDALAAWTNGTAAERTMMSGLLDALNNNDNVRVVFTQPCDVVY